jgi:integrase
VSRDRVLDDAELAAVWHAADRVGGPVGAYIKLLITSLCRKSEIGKLTWSECDLDKGLIMLPRDRTKMGVPLVQPISKIMHNVLEARHRVNGNRPFVINGEFAQGGGSYAKNLIIKNLSGGVKLEDWCFHDLRRSGASGMARLGVRPEVIEKCLGHSTKGVHGIYNRHTYEAEVRAALELWGQHIEAITK